LEHVIMRKCNKILILFYSKLVIPNVFMENALDKMNAHAKIDGLEISVIFVSNLEIL
jgi:hypothetical protein